MRNTLVMIVVLAMGFDASAAQDDSKKTTGEPVALASLVSGSVSVVEPGRERRVVGRFDWLPPGALVEVAVGSSVTLAFATGTRFELGPGSRATLVVGGLGDSSGPVSVLPPLPPLPRIQLAPAGRADRTMAVRTRGTRITGLYPADDAAALADEVVLRFSPVAGAASYRLEIEGEDGTSVFRVETVSTTVKVSAGVLKAGMRYQWTVRTIGGTSMDQGPLARGDADFSTLSSETLTARARLREAFAGSDAPSLAFLAEIDRELGLWWEAREGFQEALAKAPTDAAIRAALSAVERLLDGEETRPQGGPG